MQEGSAEEEIDEEDSREEEEEEEEELPPPVCDLVSELFKDCLPSCVAHSHFCREQEAYSETAVGLFQYQ